jgi:O-antigen/teichoic acid export membrane protein
LILAIVTGGFNTALQAMCVRKKAFKQTSSSQVIRSVSSNSAQIGFGLIRSGSVGLIVSNVLADILASMNLFRVMLKDILDFRHQFLWSRVRQLAKEYKDFPFYNAPQTLISALSGGLPVLLLTQFYGIATAGAFAFGMRILQAPMGIILRSLRQVLMQKASETIHHGDSLFPLYVKITLALSAIVFLPFLVLFIWTPQIFSFVFGMQWYVAGEYARYLILLIVVASCNLPAVLFAQLIRIQRTVLIYDVIVLVMRTLILSLGGLYLSALTTITIFSVLGALTNVFLILLVGYSINKKENKHNGKVFELH